jgi:hypothetical protein
MQTLAETGSQFRDECRSATACVDCRGMRNSFRPAHEQETVQTLAETGFQFRDEYQLLRPASTVAE